MRKKGKEKRKSVECRVRGNKEVAQPAVLGLVSESSGPVYKRVQCFHAVGVGHDFGQVEVV